MSAAWAEGVLQQAGGASGKQGAGWLAYQRARVLLLGQRQQLPLKRHVVVVQVKVLHTVNTMRLGECGVG